MSDRAAPSCRCCALAHRRCARLGRSCAFGSKKKKQSTPKTQIKKQKTKQKKQKQETKQKTKFLTNIQEKDQSMLKITRQQLGKLLKKKL